MAWALLGLRRAQGSDAKEHARRLAFATIEAHPWRASIRRSHTTPRGSNMAKQTRSDLTWTEIDPASLPKLVQDAYHAYKAQYAEMKACREVFERALNAAVSPPQGKRVVCGYNFGKLSIALADAAAAPKSSQAKGSLADFLAQASARGGSY